MAAGRAEQWRRYSHGHSYSHSHSCASRVVRAAAGLLGRAARRPRGKARCQAARGLAVAAAPAGGGDRGGGGVCGAALALAAADDAAATASGAVGAAGGGCTPPRRAAAAAAGTPVVAATATAAAAVPRRVAALRPGDRILTADGGVSTVVLVTVDPVCPVMGMELCKLRLDLASEPTGPYLTSHVEERVAELLDKEGFHNEKDIGQLWYGLALCKYKWDSGLLTRLAAGTIEEMEAWEGLAGAGDALANMAQLAESISLTPQQKAELRLQLPMPKQLLRRQVNLLLAAPRPINSDRSTRAHFSHFFRHCAKLGLTPDSPAEAQAWFDVLNDAGPAEWNVDEIRQSRWFSGPRPPRACGPRRTCVCY
eukprot:XP_001701056.1 predicted protein [Chlamydomonas reinhardtii]